VGNQVWRLEIKETKKKVKEGFIVLNKRILVFIAPVVAICALLIAKHRPGELILFLIGVVCGIFIGRNWQAKHI